MSKPCENCGADIKVCFDCDLYKGKFIEQKAGKWINLRTGGVECSECCVEQPIVSYYCPWCGAKMKSVLEGAEE